MTGTHQRAHRSAVAGDAVRQRHRLFWFVVEKGRDHTEALWARSLSTVWAASAAIVSTYAPVRGVDPADLPATPAGPDAVDAAIDRAVSHGDEHVIKFTDTATEVFDRTGDGHALAATERIRQLL